MQLNFKIITRFTVMGLSVRLSKNKSFVNIFTLMLLSSILTFCNDFVALLQVESNTFCDFKK